MTHTKCRETSEEETDQPDIEELERDLLVQVAMIDRAERTKLALAVLGPRSAPDTPLAPMLATILLLHNSASMLRNAERESLKSLIRAIAEADAIRDHQRENGGDSL